MKLANFPKISTANKWLSRHSDPVLILNYYYAPNESFRVESVAVIILIQHIFTKSLFGVGRDVKHSRKEITVYKLCFKERWAVYQGR